ncbi:MAG: SDR family NAD-dependent epimerase/dehydratase, partial [Roseococcus sp.]|nr:SDR family NAD-dependent epimerase/dehydratase [Roseococcus sp.]
TGPLNLGNPSEFTIADLADMVIEEVGHGGTIRRMPLPRDDPRQRCPDITQARRDLGWSPTIPLREGLQRTIAYFERLLTTVGTGALVKA